MPLRAPIVRNRYWNANGIGIAVAAVWEEGTPDWAAYIGARPDPASEIATTEWASRFGCKLSSEEADALFPGLADALAARGAISYRS